MSLNLWPKRKHRKKAYEQCFSQIAQQIIFCLNQRKKEGQERINALRRNLDKEDDFEKQDRIDEIETETGRSMER